jgi:proline dehydrogenase
MLVYGVEHADDAVSCDDNMQQFIRTIEAAKSLPTSHVSLIPLFFFFALFFLIILH